LTDWDYVGPLLALDQQYFGDVWLGTMWECPQLLFFGDKTILMVSVSHDDQPQQTAYLIGEYRDNRFIPQSAHLLDFGGWHYYAPQAMVDDSGRTLCWGWLRESRSDKLCEAAGWSGVMSIPRVLSLRSDDVLQIEPAPELQQLRRRHWHLTTPDTAISKQVRGTALELSVRIDPGLGRVGVRLLSSETEWTTVFYDRRRGVLGINRSNSTSAQRNEHDLSTLKGHYVLPTNEVLELRIFVDQSVIEVFANGQACVSGRAYPSRTESDGIEILVDEDEFVSADIWTLDTIW
jgi:beta-fructofuranosidase